MAAARSIQHAIDEDRLCATRDRRIVAPYNVVPGICEKGCVTASIVAEESHMRLAVSNNKMQSGIVRGGIGPEDGFIGGHIASVNPGHRCEVATEAQCLRWRRADMLRCSGELNRCAERGV